FGQRDLDVMEGADLHLVAAPAPGLQHAHETRRLHLGDRLRQDTALLPLLHRTLRECRDHRPRAREQLRRVGHSYALRSFHREPRLRRIMLKLKHIDAAHSAEFPSPLWGGVRGGGRSWRTHLVQQQRPPSPTLPHKGGGSRPSLSLALTPTHRTL